MAGTAVGSVNFFNYMGAGTQGFVIGMILDATKNWGIVFGLLSGCAILGIILVNIVRE
jgi:sugar phosphate permease